MLSTKTPRFSPPFAALLGLLCCGMVACFTSGRTPEVLTSDFCAAAYRGDLKAAGEAASEVTAPLDDSMARNPHATRLLADVNERFQPWRVERAKLFAALDTVDSLGGKKRGVLLIE